MISLSDLPMSLSELPLNISFYKSTKQLMNKKFESEIFVTVYVTKMEGTPIKNLRIDFHLQNRQKNIGSTNFSKNAEIASKEKVH